MKKYQGYDAKEVLAQRRVARRRTARVWIGQVFPHLSIASQLLALLPHRKESDE